MGRTTDWSPGPGHRVFLRDVVLCALTVLFAGSGAISAAQPSPTPLPKVVTALTSEELVDFPSNPPVVQSLLEKCLALTRQNLGYQFGSSDPENGGMDCSGTIFHVLRKEGIEDVPRTASEQYVWARKADNFEAVVSRKKDSFELDDLHPGDLLFWTGTYATDRDPPVTHTMIYLGKLKKDGRQVMFGASDGRTFDGRKMYGVSVFDFTISKAKPRPATGEPPPAPGSIFIGYAKIPGLGVKKPAREDSSSESASASKTSDDADRKKSAPTERKAE